jgi:hypothetical protein
VPLAELEVPEWDDAVDGWVAEIASAIGHRSLKGCTVHGRTVVVDADVCGCAACRGWVDARLRGVADGGGGAGVWSDRACGATVQWVGGTLVRSLDGGGEAGTAVLVQVPVAAATGEEDAAEEDRAVCAGTRLTGVSVGLPGLARRAELFLEHAVGAVAQRDAVKELIDGCTLDQITIDDYDDPHRWHAAEAQRLAACMEAAAQLHCLDAFRREVWAPAGLLPVGAAAQFQQRQGWQILEELSVPREDMPSVSSLGIALSFAAAVPQLEEELGPEPQPDSAAAAVLQRLSSIHCEPAMRRLSPAGMAAILGVAVLICPACDEEGVQVGFLASQLEGKLKRSDPATGEVREPPLALPPPPPPPPAFLGVHGWTGRWWLTAVVSVVSGGGGARVAGAARDRAGGPESRGQAQARQYCAAE